MSGQIHKSEAAIHKIALTGARASSTIILTILVATTIFVLLGSLTNYLRILTVVSASMEPAIPVGSLIVVMPITRDQIEVKDVLTLQHPEQPDILVTHRVVEVMKQNGQVAVRTKGDANAAIDPWHLQLMGETVWKTRLVIPGLGYLFEWLRASFLHVLLILGVPIAINILWMYVLWRRKTGKHRRGHEA